MRYHNRNDCRGATRHPFPTVKRKTTNTVIHPHAAHVYDPIRSLTPLHGL
eukprot:m.3233 g.3233  ORF g.3233 m.3233 type:complete len:50 (+) comp3885_c0_seq1:106-255(+)